MRRPQGYSLLVEGDGSIHEADTFTCKHCQAIVIVPPRADPASMGGLCRTCNGLICPRCVSLDRCLPWEEAMRRAEDKARFWRELEG